MTLRHSLTSFLAVAADVGQKAAETSDAVQAAADAATEAAAQPGIFDAFVTVIENMLKYLEAGLSDAGVPYAYGYSIILFTCFVKLLTFPLSQKQMESAISMQGLQPKMKALQKKYQSDPQKLQLETANLYKESGVNPLAGCLPSLATLPVWIALYRALTTLAKEGDLVQGFYWIPTLAGPASIDSPGLSWLIPLTDGAPPVGWPSALAYLVLPVLLVASQWWTMQLNQPKNPDPQQEQANAILKFLPLMLGYFSLTMPSGLSLYWFTNNLLSSLQQYLIKKAYTNKNPQMGPAIEEPTATMSFASKNGASKSTSSTGAASDRTVGTAKGKTVRRKAPKKK